MKRDRIEVGKQYWVRALGDIHAAQVVSNPEPGYWTADLLVPGPCGIVCCVGLKARQVLELVAAG